MRKILIVALPVLLFASLATAQVPSGNVFFGYSYYSTNLSTIDRANTSGWEGTVEGKFLPFISVVGDFSGHFGSELFPIDCPAGLGNCTLKANISEHDYLFGPRVSVSVARFRPFGELLFGAAHANANGLTSGTSFATAVGGGLDYKVFGPVAWRLQGDYVHTHLFNAGQGNLRISTGIVLRF